MGKFVSEDRSLRLRLVYCGPPEAGKRTNLQRVCEAIHGEGGGGEEQKQS